MTDTTEALRVQFEKYVNPAVDMKMHRVSGGGYASHGMNQSWHDFQAGHAAAVAGPSDRIPIEDSIAWQETGTGVERNAVMVSGRTWYRDDHPLLALTTQAAPQREVFDEDGFRAWVIRNLPDNTIIGSSEYWANYLAAWVQRFMSAASQDAEDALVAALIECDRLTESMRIWAGTGYHYHPPQARQIHDTARAAIGAARAAKEGETNAIRDDEV